MLHVREPKISDNGVVLSAPPIIYTYTFTLQAYLCTQDEQTFLFVWFPCVFSALFSFSAQGRPLAISAVPVGANIRDEGLVLTRIENQRAPSPVPSTPLPFSLQPGLTIGRSLPRA